MDKRKVHTDALETLGTIIDETAKRDAIHLAVEPVIAKERLYPSEHVTADGRGSYWGDDDAVGIVDPFLSKCVNKGERFWLVLYPRQITSLRHVWEHPMFPPCEVPVIEEIEEMSLEMQESKKWIEDFVNECHEYIDYDYSGDELSYETLMKHTDYWVMLPEKDYNDYFNTGNMDKYLPREFWHHYEIIRGKKVEENKKVNFFSCSC